jgi:serine protease AprX
VSLRVPGSHIDRTFGATARVGKTRFFRGSGTSQAAAFVSGLAALIIQQRPTIKPDELKALLKSTASPIPNVSARLQGAGVANMTRIARRIPTPVGTQSFARGTGLGSLEAARGTQHLVAANGIELRGEQDIFGTYLTGSLWAPLSQLGNAWNGGTWMGNAWTGNAWTGNAWTGNAWAGNAWAGNAWAGNAWYGNAWSANAWSANAWNGNAWVGNAWAGNAWEGNAWSGNAWPGNAWSTHAWGG